MKNLKVAPWISVKDAMERLDSTAEKVLLVVDEKERLLGSLTDGDIRRHILKNKSITESIEDVFNTQPFFVYERDYNKAELKQLFATYKLNLIPILDKESVVKNYVTWGEMFGNNIAKKRKCVDAPVVIMAGGKGTRLEPFTKVLPKPLIPVGDKTIVDHIIERFCEYGINKFYFTINYMAKIIRAYFEEKVHDYSVGFAQEEEFRGTAGSLKLLRDQLTTPFFVSNCDILIEADYSDIYEFHLQNNYDITLVAAAKQFHIPYGICELNGNGSLKKIKEKPQYNFLVNTGLYVLKPESLSLIPDQGIFHITHLMEKIQSKGGHVGVYPVSDNSWIDVGQWTEYKKALKVIEHN